jgi:uncharacterized protein with ParB-like and HNH nuclease domain
MAKEETYVKILDETDEADDYSDDDLYNIDSWGADLSFRELITMYDEGELLKPELQRNYVWDKAEASRFIESLLLNLPVPSIFLAKIGNERTLIIDGYQRIMTVYEYVLKGVFSKDGKAFKLSNSQRINERWRGKSFAELTDSEQRRIRSTTIHAIIFRQKAPKDNDTSLFQVFERINTSGRTLTSQEIRNCVYQGNFNKVLIELNTLKVWRKLYGTKKPDVRMKDIEFILRFFTLSQDSLRKLKVSSVSLKKTLNDFMGSTESINPKILEKRKETFESTMNFIDEHIGKNAFFNVSEKGKIIPKLHPTIFDAIAIATLLYLETGKMKKIVDFSDRRKRLLADEKFKEFIAIRTTNLESINGRIAKASEYLYGSAK